MKRARRSTRLAPAVLASALLHTGMVALFFVGGASAEPPKVKVYEVDIVSLPPNQAGDPPKEPPMTTEPSVEAAPVVQPAEEDASTAPVAPEPAAEPARVPEPTRSTPAPEAAKPVPPREPRPTPPAPTPAAKPAPAATPPQAAKPAPAAKPIPAAAPAPPAARPAPPRPPATEGTGSRPVAATGQRPVAATLGGEGLNVRTEGAEFVDRAYLENIIRQVRRYFRPPADARTDRAEVRFWIERDGSVVDIEIVRSSGSFAFRTAAMEGVEQAGKRGAFGPLPRAFPADRLPIVFEFLPPR